MRDKVRSTSPSSPETSAASPVSLDPVLGLRIAQAVGITLTHPDKIVYPGTSITKAHLAAYYAAVAHRMLPHIVDRPLSLVRGADNKLTETFFQKHLLPGMPPQLKSGNLTKVSGKDSRILWVEDVDGLVAGVQMKHWNFTYGGHVGGPRTRWSA